MIAENTTKWNRSTLSAQHSWRTFSCEVRVNTVPLSSTKLLLRRSVNSPLLVLCSAALIVTSCALHPPNAAHDDTVQGKEPSVRREYWTLPVAGVPNLYLK